MASFSDQISQFNPYVSQLPVEAMVKVGMQKQAQYDQGVQKIQGYIDNIAGIELVKDSHKAMLQSKLNTLGSKLKTVAAGDFSNQQLVNSVGGMATQIVKDKDVQNAMYSTSAYKKQMQRAEEDAKKSGGANVYNRDKFLKQTQNWLNDGSVNSTYNVEYADHRDVYKKLVEIGKTVGLDSTTTQNLFQTDANGKPVMVDGRLQYNDVMVETLTKGKDKSKILEAFQAGLDPADYRQLAINGEYELKNKTPEELNGMLDNSFKSYQKNILLRKQSIQDKILEIKSTNFDPKEQVLADEKVKELEESLLTLDNNLSKRAQSVEKAKASDPDTIRSSIYTDNFLDSVSDALSEKETATKYSKNPAVEVMFERERLQISKSAEARQLAEFKYRQKHDESQMAFDTWKVKFEAGLVDEFGRPTGGSRSASGKRELPLDDITNPSYYTSKFEEGLNADLDVKQGLYEKVAVAYWKSINSEKNLSDNQVRAAIGSYAKKLGMSYNDYIILQGSKAVQNMNTNKNTILGPEFIPTIKEINALDKSITNKLAKQKEADRIVAETAKLEGFKAFDYKTSGIKPANVTIPVIKDGRVENKVVNLSTEDLYKFAVINKAGDQGGDLFPGPSVFRSRETREEAKKLRESLIAKYGETTFNTLQKKLYTPSSALMYSTGATPLTAMTKALESNEFKKTQKLKEDYYKSISSVQAPQTQILYKGKPEQEKKLASNIASIVSEYAGIGGYEEFAQYATDPKANFQVNINPPASAYGKNSYSLQMTKPDGTIVEKPIVEKHYEFLTEQAAPVVRENNLQSNINAFGTGSTNSGHHYTDKDAYTTAYFKPDEFPNTKKYQVAADFAQGANGRYFPKLYINTGAGYKFYNYNPGRGFEGYTLEEAEAFPQVVVDDVFISGLLQRK